MSPGEEENEAQLWRSPEHTFLAEKQAAPEMVPPSSGQAWTTRWTSFIQQIFFRAFHRKAQEILVTSHPEIPVPAQSNLRQGQGA